MSNCLLRTHIPVFPVAPQRYCTRRRRGCPQPLGPLGPLGLMCAPSVERGGGGNGWADGLTGGALRAGPALPTKNFRRAAPGAGLGRFHCHGREPNEAVIEPNPHKLSASSAPGRPPKGNGANLHNSFTWGEAAALLRVSGRTVIHAARVLSEDSPAAPAARLAVEQGRITVSDASRVMDEPAEVQLRALERVTGGGSRNLAGAAQGLPPGGGGLRWWPRLSAVLGRPHGGSGERRHDGSHQPARTWGEVRRWWCQVRSGCGGGKRGTGLPAPGHARHIPLAVLRATERHRAVPFCLVLRMGVLCR